MGLSCPSAYQLNGLLCYPKCKEGYQAFGCCVCNGMCPSGFTDTGADCLKPNSYGRGTGVAPTLTCGEGQELWGLRCYPKCESGYDAFGCCLCHGICPPGFADNPAYCEKPSSYGRGTGHFTEENCLKSNDHGAARNGCEQWGAFWYPKCDPNFHNVACCVCSPNCPSGWNDIGIACQKPTYTRGTGVEATLTCQEGYELNGLLCYPKCKDGFHAVGCCVCSPDCPTGDGWVDIGVSCQKPSYGRGVGIPAQLNWKGLITIIILAIVCIFVIIIIISIAKSTGKVVAQNPELLA